MEMKIKEAKNLIIIFSENTICIVFCFYFDVDSELCFISLKDFTKE